MPGSKMGERKNYLSQTHRTAQRKKRQRAAISPVLSSPVKAYWEKTPGTQSKHHFLHSRTLLISTAVQPHKRVDASHAAAAVINGGGSAGAMPIFWSQAFPTCSPGILPHHIPTPESPRETVHQVNSTAPGPSDGAPIASSTLAVSYFPPSHIITTPHTYYPHAHRQNNHHILHRKSRPPHLTQKPTRGRNCADPKAKHLQRQTNKNSRRE
jgi:hypothetical protein